MTKVVEAHVRDLLLGEIETEIVGMQYHKARIHPGEQINVERESKNTHDRRAIRVENGHFEPVGYLPKSMASWLAPLIDDGKIHVDGYVPQCHPETIGDSGHCPVVISFFESEKGHGLLEKVEPNDKTPPHRAVCPVPAADGPACPQGREGGCFIIFDESPQKIPNPQAQGIGGHQSRLPCRGWPGIGKSEVPRDRRGGRSPEKPFPLPPVRLPAGLFLPGTAQQHRCSPTSRLDLPTPPGFYWAKNRLDLRWVRRNWKDI